MCGTGFHLKLRAEHRLERYGASNDYDLDAHRGFLALDMVRFGDIWWTWSSAYVAGEPS